MTANFLFFAQGKRETVDVGRAVVSLQKLLRRALIRVDKGAHELNRLGRGSSLVSLVSRDGDVRKQTGRRQEVVGEALLFRGRIRFRNSAHL